MGSMDIDDLEAGRSDAVMTRPNLSSPPPQQLFWAPKTLYTLICDQIDTTFASYRCTDRPDWKVVIVVSSLDSPIATWYRCKLGIPPREEGVIVARTHVRVEFALTSPQDLAHLDFEHAGLLIVNVDDQEGWKDIEAGIEQELSAKAAYLTSKLLVQWVGPNSSKQDSGTSQAIDISDINGGLSRILESALQTVIPN